MPLVPVTILIPLIIFWIWMFSDMINNQSIPRDSRSFWLIGFIFVGILTAGYYYFTEYKNR